MGVLGCMCVVKAGTLTRKWIGTGLRPALPLLLGAGWMAMGVALRGQEAAPAGMDATALVRRAILRWPAEEKSHRPMQNLLRRRDERRDTTKEIIETKDGDVARLVAIDGKPLSADANQAELQRLDDLKAHPEMQQRRKRSEQKDQDRVDRLMGRLPDAFIYRMEGVEPCASGRCYRLSFTPNAKWQPPDMESEFFRGVEGEVWISQSAERLTRLEARFVADVSIGMGIVGKVYKGGTVTLEETDVGGNDWELTRMTMHVTGKVFLVKSMSYQMTQEASHFSPVTPGMGYAAAIEMLKQLPMDGTAGEK